MGDGMTPRPAEPYSSAELTRAVEVLRYHDARMAATVDELVITEGKLRGALVGSNKAAERRGRQRDEWKARAERAEQQIAAHVTAARRLADAYEANIGRTGETWNALFAAIGGVTALLDASTTDEPTEPCGVMVPAIPGLSNGFYCQRPKPCELHPASDTPCPTCGGTRKVPDQHAAPGWDGHAPCPDCAPCPTCGGKGDIQVLPGVRWPCPDCSDTPEGP